MTTRTMPTILDLGCGNDRQPGAWGIDIVPGLGDQTIDLAQAPWPLPSDHFTVVYACQILEHLVDPVRAMQEIYRICHHGALVVASVPDGCCEGYVQDPTHKRPWNIGTFLYFCPGQWPKGWANIDYGISTRFRVMDYYIHHGEPSILGPTFRDDLRVYLQVIKED